jgi:XTP/dITP diphosphohydrolase
MIYFITSNPYKFSYAKKELKSYGIDIEQKKLDIKEIQSEDVSIVLTDKADKAFKEIKKPLLITDSSFSIPSLNGFPGPYMHSITNWFSTDDFLNLMRDKENKSILLEYYAIYKDKNTEKLFKLSLSGEFIQESIGEDGSSLDKVVTFRKDQKTIAECEDLNMNYHDLDNHPLWSKVGPWLQKYYE